MNPRNFSKAWINIQKAFRFWVLNPWIQSVMELIFGYWGYSSLGNTASNVVMMPSSYIKMAVVANVSFHSTSISR